MTDEKASKSKENYWPTIPLKTKAILIALFVLAGVLWSAKTNGIYATFDTNGYVGIFWQALIAVSSVVIGIPVALEINRQQISAEERASLRSRISEAEETFIQFEKDINENMKRVEILLIKLQTGEIIPQRLNTFFADTFTPNVIGLVSWEFRQELLTYQYLLHETSRLVDYAQACGFSPAVRQVAEESIKNLEAIGGERLKSRISDWLKKTFEEKLRRE